MVMQSLVCAGAVKASDDWQRIRGMTRGTAGR